MICQRWCPRQCVTKEGWHFFSLASTGFSILNLIAVETLFTSENLTGLRYDLCAGKTCKV
jgi:hypothetical protein